MRQLANECAALSKAPEGKQPGHPRSMRSRQPLPPPPIVNFKATDSEERAQTFLDGADRCAPRGSDGTRDKKAGARRHSLPRQPCVSRRRSWVEPRSLCSPWPPPATSKSGPQLCWTTRPRRRSISLEQDFLTWQVQPEEKIKIEPTCVDNFQEGMARKKSRSSQRTRRDRQDHRHRGPGIG